MALRRLQKDYTYLMQNPIPVGSVEQTDDPFVWKAYIIGPLDTPYEGGTFEVEIKFPQNYPNNRPDVKFNTKIFHANVIMDSGHICVSLMNEWRSTDTVSTILLAITNLLCDPNRSDSINNSRTMSDKEYEEEAKRYTQLYAM
jgi:ubiquitin-conjugating enzyme E2 D/E